MLQDLGRQRVVFSQLLQHFLVGARRTARGLLDHRQAELGEENLADLLGAAQVEGLVCQRMCFLLQLQDAQAQLGALPCQRGRVNQHAVALHAVQRLAAFHFKLVDETQLVITLQLRPQHPVDIERLVGVLAGVLGRLVHRHLRKGNLVRALARHHFIVDAAAAQVALGQAGQAMGLVHFKHVALQHGVVRIALHLDAVVGEHVAVVLDVLAKLLLLRVLQPGLHAGQHFLPRQLLGRVAVVVGQRYVGGLARLDAERHADDLRTHLVQRAGLRVNGSQLACFKPRHPVVELRPGEDGVVLQVGDLWLRGHVRLVEQAGAG